MFGIGGCEEFHILGEAMRKVRASNERLWTENKWRADECVDLVGLVIL